MQTDEILLPWSFEAEASVISALLMDSNRFDQIGHIVVAEMFNDLRHRAIYTEIAKMVMSCKPVDTVTVYEAMQQAGTLGELTLFDLNDIAQYAPSNASLTRYAEIVAERALMRGLMGAADKAREIAVTPGLSASERLDQCQNAFQQLTAARVAREPKPVSEFVVSLIDRLNDLAEGSKQPGRRTRIPTLDNLLGGGFKDGKQIVLAARPSVGKSALAMEFGYALASQGFPVGFLSQEMESAELVDRLAARIGSVGLDGFSTGKLSDSEWASLTDAIEQIGNLPLYIDDQPGLTLGDIQAKARKLKREHDIKLLVVDYLQLCTPSDSKASRHHQIEEISRGLKVLAKQLGITTVVLSQLNREVEKRVNGRPTLADLKESGAIEEDADTVILLSADGARESGDVVVHAEVAKNRGGKKGFVKLAFTGKFQRFVETVADGREFGATAKPRRSYTEEV
jgi:replicative DNA helicase